MTPENGAAGAGHCPLGPRCRPPHRARRTLAVALALWLLLAGFGPAPAIAAGGLSPPAAEPSSPRAAPAAVRPPREDVPEPPAPDGLRLDVVTLVLSYSPGTLRALESFTLLPEGDVSAPVPLPLPAGARNVAVEGGSDGSGWVQAPWGLMYRSGPRDRDPIRISVTFELPAESLTGVFSQRLPYSAAGLLVLADTTTLAAPPSLNTTLADGGQATVAGRAMQQLTRGAVPAGTELRLNLQYVPEQGQQAPNATAVPEPAWLRRLLPAGLALLFALAAWIGFLVYRRPAARGG